MTLVMWQNIVSPHQFPYIRLLPKVVSDWRVILVVDEVMSDRRKVMGWSPPSELADVEFVVAPSESRIRTLLQLPGAIHTFTGFRISPLIRTAFRRAVARDCKVGLISESVDFRGLKGSVRTLLGKTVLERRYVTAVDFVMCMGELGKQWYRRFGYAEDSLFDFCYVVDPPAERALPEGRGDTLVYVGQLIERKGVDLLLRALKQIRSNGLDVRLLVVGDGVGRMGLEKLSHVCGFQDEVRFLGSLSNELIWKILKTSRALVLPSRFDGWGAVVNEALMTGTPVVCTDRCGAAQLVSSSGFGEVCRACDADALADAVSRVLRTEFAERDIQLWAKKIDSDSVAGYFGDVIGYIDGSIPRRPVAPWLT